MDKVRQIVSNNDLGKISEISILEQGYSSTPYKIVTDTGTYVLLLARTEKTGREHRYLQQSAVLKALEKSNYKHSPRYINVDKNGRWLLETYWPGDMLKDVPGVDPLTVWKDVLTALFDVQKLEVNTLEQEYLTIGLEFDFDDKKPSDPERRWTIEPYNTVKRLDNDKKLTKTLSPLVEQNLEHLSRFDKKKAVIRFVHGDIGSTHIIINNKCLGLLDWELSRFVWASGEYSYELAYIFSHNKKAVKHKMQLVEYVAKHNQINPTKLGKVVDAGLRFTKVNDILWAASMYLGALHGEVDDPPETYKPILDKRMLEFTKIYGWKFS